MKNFSLDELSALLFNGTREDSVNASVSQNQTLIIYGTALSKSQDGQVLVQLDDAVYSADDLEDEEYEVLTLTEDDDIDSINEDEELIDQDDPDYDEDDQDIIFWQFQDDQATEQEN